MTVVTGVWAQDTYYPLTTEGVPPYCGTIYVATTGSDDNDGSENAPVATVGKAIELALVNNGSGEIIINEGTYVGNGYHVTGDLTVTGNGKVTLDANNEGRLFYMEYGESANKIELHNLILTNANGYGAAVYSLANELILDKVNIVKNNANGFLIKSNGKLSITDSEISESMSGNVIQQDASGDILIKNTVFEDNSIVDNASVMAVVNINSESGNMVVENSKFKNNTARQGVIKGNSNYNIEVKGTEFKNNTNTVSYGGAIYANGGILNITDCVFDSNKAYRSGGAVYVGYRVTATVDSCIFINNTANTAVDEYYGDAIYNGNKLTVTNSAFLGGYNNYMIYNDGEDNEVTAQNCWWGTNEDPSSMNGVGYYEDDDWEEYDCPQVDVSDWATMNATFTPASAQAGEEVTVTATFSNDNLPDGIPVTFTSTSGNLDAVVSTVGAKASTTYTIDANDGAITATSGNATVDMPIVSNIVTQSNFYDFFDENGSLLDNVTFDELIFKGEFENLVDCISILSPLTIVGDEATLKNIGFKIIGTNVTLDSLKFVATTSLGALIDVNSDDVNLKNLDITYNGGDEEAVAINVTGDDVKILNNTIFFESHVTDDSKFATALKLTDCSNVLVDGNSITTQLPCVYVCNYDEDYYMMGSDRVNSVRLKDCDNLEFTNNIIRSTTNEYSSEFPTIQSIQVMGCNNSVLDHNNISLIDEMTPAGMDNYIYGINSGYNTKVTFSNNTFSMSTMGGQDSRGTAYAFQSVESDVNIIGDSITSISNGPNIGIYVASMYGENSDFNIKDNFIKVTGCASSTGSWALVSGIEIQNGDAKVYNNEIYTYNVNDYDEDAYMHGISYAQWMYGDRSFDIQDNTVYSDGKYAISVINATSLNVVNNTLYAHELKSDNAVNPGDCENAIIKDNLPIASNIVTQSNFYDFFDEYGSLLDNVTFDELIFQGEFSDLVSYITLDRPIAITGENAVLKDMGFVIAGDDVILDSLTLVANSDLGNLIDIASENTVISNMNITYVVSEAASAINVYPGANNVQILNNTIYFESTVEEYTMDDVTSAICVNSGISIFDEEDPIEGLVIDGNKITAVIPAFLADVYEHEYYVMGLSAVNGIRINGAEDFGFTNNKLDVTTNRLDRITPTYQAMYVAKSSGLIDGNNITMNDTITPVGKDVYLYALDLLYDEDLTISNDTINISTAGGKFEAGAACAILAIASDFSMESNSITTTSKGSNTAVFFPSRMGLPCDAIIADNFISVTGLATTHNTGLVSGIEIQTGSIEISGNKICAYNIGEYADDNNIYGISYAQDGVTSEVVITDNIVITEGHHAISFLDVDDAVIKDNYLASADLKGDNAVEIKEGSGNTVKDNVRVVIKDDLQGYIVYQAEDGDNPNPDPLPDDAGLIELTYSRTLAAPGSTEGSGDTQIDGKPANLFTICLPFTPETGDAVKYYTLSSVSGETVNFDEVAEPVANTPYLMAVFGTGSFTVSCTELEVSSMTINSTTVDGYTFNGTFTGMTNADAQGKHVLQSSNRWGKVTAEKSAAFIPPFRAFIEGPANCARLLSGSIDVSDDNATGIKYIRTQNIDGTEYYFDLNGRRIEKPATKGVYIHNGRKEVLK